MTDTVLGAIIGVGGAIIGVILAGPVTYYFSKVLVKMTHENAIDIMRRQEFNESAATFRNVFLTELSGLYPYPISWPENIILFLESKFTVLNAAVGEFRYYLPDKEWDGFDSAWFSFYNSTGREIDNKNCQCYLHYKPSISTYIVNGKEIREDTTKTYKETFKHNVDNLLKYAKEK